VKAILFVLYEPPTDERFLAQVSQSTHGIMRKLVQ